MPNWFEWEFMNNKKGICIFMVAALAAVVQGCGSDEVEDPLVRPVNESDDRLPVGVGGPEEQNSDEVEVAGRGDGEPDRNELKQEQLMREPTPEWLVIGDPVEVAILGSEPYEAGKHRIQSEISVSGGTIHISDKKYYVGNGFFPTDASMDDRNGLIVIRSHADCRIYQIVGEELQFRDDLPLPQYNYGEDRRWYINDWEWLDRNTLLGRSIEEDWETDLVADARLYAYTLDSNTLRRVSLPERIVDPYDPFIEIISVDNGIVTLRTLRLGESSVVHQVDFYGDTAE